MKLNIQKEIEELRKSKDRYIGKWRRNYRLYNNTPNASLENMKEPTVIGLYNGFSHEEVDTTETPSVNVIRSCVDTLVSKISESKVRPFFNTINGSFKDITICKQAQQFFDVLYDTYNVNKVVSEAFRDACIFDTGVVYIDEDEQSIRKALPFQVNIKPNEMTYGKITKVFYERRDYPISLLPKKVAKVIKNNCINEIDYGIYYDIFNKVKVYTGNGRILLQEDYTKEVIPFIFLHYSNPTFGVSGLSIADVLTGIQAEINILMDKIKTASQLNPALTFFVPEGSSIKTAQLNNRIGNVVSYKPIGGMGGSPVTSTTPAFIDSQYLDLLDNLVQKAYEMVGISMLSAQSKKPVGIESGVGLATLENVESDRFETQLNQVIHAYVDIAKTCIKVFDNTTNILPNDKNRVSITWGDIVKAEKNFSIQFSSADSLSKDPSMKLQQLQALAQAGVIQSSRIAQLMELPDLETGYNIAQNASNAVMNLVSDCVNNDVYDIPDFIPIELVKEECTNAMLSLFACNEKGKNNSDIQKLLKLYEIAEEKEIALNQPPELLPEEKAQVEQAQEQMATENANAQTVPQNAPQNVSTPIQQKPKKSNETVDNQQLELFPNDDSDYVSGDWTTNSQ